MKKKTRILPGNNRIIYQNNLFYAQNYPAYQGPFKAYPGRARLESRGWVWACALLCLTVIAAGVYGGILFCYGQREPLGSKGNPAGIGQAFLIESEEQVGATDEMVRCKSKITLTQAIRGDAAAQIIAQLPEGHKLKPTGAQEYYIAKFKIQLLESNGGSGVQYSSIFFDAMNQRAEKYRDWIDGISGNFPLAATGEESEGIIIFLVEKQDDPVILYKAAENQYYYFRPGI